MRKDTTDYYKEEMDKIDTMLRHYTEWGYSTELNPLVDALQECYSKLKAEYKRLMLEKINNL